MTISRKRIEKDTDSKSHLPLSDSMDCKKKTKKNEDDLVYGRPTHVKKKKIKKKQQKNCFVFFVRLK